MAAAGEFDVSRIVNKSSLMNSDIQDELELTDDITFDKNIKLEFESRAARVIQRWWYTRI